MAESAVNFLLEKLSFLLEEEVKLLTGFREEVVSLKAELESMKAFLHVADAVEDEDEEIKVWVKQVREASFDAEDILDEYFYRFAEQHQKRHGFYGHLFKIAHTIKTLKSLHRIASELRSIKSRVSDISSRHQRYRYNSNILQDEGSSSSAGRKSALYELRRDEALLLEEGQLVGIEKPKQELVSWLLKDEVSNVQVVAVVGMGGLGKTTLVYQVYRDDEVKQRFQHRAWITVSQSFDLRELLVQIIEQLLRGIAQPIPNETYFKDILSLKQDVICFLGDKKYLIVLDDLWSVGSWDDLKNAFPQNNHGSRLMVTSRIVEVASATTTDRFGGYTFPLKPLSSEESWNLFCARTFHRKSCPNHLEDISQDILKRCMGLPLAIVAVSGVLATKDTSKISEWKIFRRSFEAGFDNNDKLKNVKKILSLSFSDLPYRLKSCFLYLSLFPEDFMFSKLYIINIWVAEGFIREMEDMTLEEVGEWYFNELCNRSLIETAAEDVDEAFKYFVLHDLVREIVLQKSKDQNFATIISEQNPVLLEPARHLSVSTTLENFRGGHNFSRVRTLLLFGAKGSISSISFSELCSKYGRLKLLKVLDCQGLPLDTFPECITKLYNLRYLNLSGTKVASIPRTIGRLRNLEMLNLENSLVEELPAKILQLHRLFRVMAFQSINDGSAFTKNIGVRVPKDIGNLKFLQDLGVIRASEGGLELMRSLGNLKQLRTLDIQQLEAEHGAALCSAIEKLGCLRRLYMETGEEAEILEVQNISSPPQCLKRLYMYGRLEMLPQWVPRLSSLGVLRLRWSKLRLDPLQSLQALPNLQELIFEKAHDGEELCIKAGGFQNLKHLTFICLSGLRKVTVEQGAMPKLQELWLEDCKLLEEVPLGVEFLACLNKLHIINMGDQLLSKLDPSSQDSDYLRVKHVPKVYIGSRDADGLHETKLS
ncbi:Disease resistance protein RPM1 [Morus notabilis]|uniref:Disease resistance protein RPM1 n=1 Tax=Morus notabilis TaxID=981085 RepID=W9RZC7_9ROSA|nr:disease resistance protein RPM1 [Morus notabilis]EXC04630.1 Disease resistance protein RPM1 [Morus notabilis]